MAIYGSLVYMSGIIGGWIADRVLGMNQTVFYGGVSDHDWSYYFSVARWFHCIINFHAVYRYWDRLTKAERWWNGWRTIHKKDPRRDSGFSIYYMGINMGGFLAPLIVGTIGETYSFHLGFAIAGIGMFAGLVVYLLTRKKYLGLAGIQVPNPLL